MRKHISVFGFFVKSSLFWVLLIMMVLGAAEVLLFERELTATLEVYEAVGEYFTAPEKVVAGSGIGVCFAVAFVAVTVLLCLPGCAFRSQTGYTLRRLSVSERAIYVHQGVYNTLIYLLLWAFQAVMAFVLCYIYITRAPSEAVGSQTVFLAFYRNDLLHSLVPLSDVALWVRNALLALTLGFAAAEVPFLHRRKKHGAMIIGMVLFTIGIFKRAIGEIPQMVGVVVVFLAVAGATIYTLFGRTEEEESENENQDS